MNIDRSQALALYTFIFAHINSEKTDELFDNESFATLQDFKDQLQDYLVGGDVNYCRYTEETTADADEQDSEECGDCDGCSCDDDSDEDEESDDEDSDDEDEGEDEETKDLPPADEFVTPGELNDLPSVLVTSPSGDKITLEFEDIDEPDLVDLLLDEGGVIIESITRIKLNGKSIEFFNGEEWHVFLLEKKLPKTWKKLMSEGTVYGVAVQEEKE